MAKPNLPESEADDGGSAAQRGQEATAPTREDPPPPYDVVAHLPSTPTSALTPTFAGHPLASVTPLPRAHLYLPLATPSSLPSTPGGSPCCSTCMAMAAARTCVHACPHSDATSAASWVGSTTPTSETTLTTTASSGAAFTPTRPALAWGGVLQDTCQDTCQGAAAHVCSPQATALCAPSPTTPTHCPSPAAARAPFLPSAETVLTPASLPGPDLGPGPERAEQSAPAREPHPAPTAGVPDTVPEGAPEAATTSVAVVGVPAELNPADTDVNKRFPRAGRMSTRHARAALPAKLYDSENGYPPLSAFSRLTPWQKKLLIFSIVWTTLIVFAGVLGVYLISVASYS